MNRNVIMLTAAIILVCCSLKKGRTTFKSYYSNGSLKTTTEMEDGKKDGQEEIFSINGNRIITQHFKNDMLVDSFYQYSETIADKLILRGYCVPKTHVVTRVVNPNRLFAENDYLASMVSDGPVNIYDEKGNLASMTMMKEGKNEGMRVIYYRNGNIRLIEHYKSGLLVPPTLKFDSSENLIFKVPVN